MSKPNFTFGNTGATGSFGAFGQPSSSTQAGSTSNTPGSTSTQQGSIFGGATQPSSNTNLFGASTATRDSQKPLAFGSNMASTPASGTSTPSLFGASTGNGSGSGLFGGTTNTQGASNPFGGAGFAFGKKTEEKKDNPTPAVSGFQTQDKTGTPSFASSSSLFEGATTASAPPSFGTSTPSSSAPAGSTTPATSKPGGLFNFMNSTTPAGPPPSDANSGAKSSLFGLSQPSSGGIFGNPKALDTTAKPATTQPNNMFAASVSTGASPSNAWAPKTTASTSGAGLFSSLNATKPTTTASSVPSTSSAAATKSPFSFTSTGTVSSPLTVTQAPNPFGAASSTSSTPATMAPAPAPSLFSSATPSTSSGSAPTHTSSLFANLGKPNATTASTTTSAPETNTSTPASSLFGSKTTQTTNSATPTSSAAVNETTTSAAPASAPAGGLGASISTPLAASSVGPAPQLSRLKNKTMDEIITRWATDLSTYQKEFQNQAAKVASWDRLLVENGDKIQKLYTSTFEAERASAEVERQLASVESQQDELTAWLDHYEREVDDMFMKQVGHGESLQGPDQERERTYKLAEKLTDRLDEMGRDLTSMIQEINTASATLTKTSKPDDPLSQIVRVLNGHLSQLQWIDQNTVALQAKITAAQKTGQSIGSNGYGGAENDSADEFYRSYMGRR